MVIEREAPGVTFAMISKSLAVTETAMLSRAVSGLRGRTLIVNLPGSKKGALECFDFIKGPLSHALHLLNDDAAKVQEAHRIIQGVEDDIRLKTAGSKVKVDIVSRPRESPYPLHEVNDAMKIIFKVCAPTEETVTRSLEHIINCILAEPVKANQPYPPFAASIKDGYAVRYEDGLGSRLVRDAVAAGDKPNKSPLVKGEAIRISTGAPIPEGANAVVQVEDTSLLKASEDGTREVAISVNVAPTQGQDIRPVGCDIPEGSLVLPKYSRIDAASLGVLATLGYTEVHIYKKPSIGVLSTGNELCSHRDEVKPGQIRDSNKLTLMNLLSQHGYDPNDCGIAKDNPDSVKSALETAFSKTDVIITTGGVSMGEYDVIKQVLLEDFDAEIHFARVNMKPGKPTTFATVNYKGRRKIVFGLPGNPVSATVTSLLFVIPTLKYIQHDPNYALPKLKTSVKGNPIVNNDSRAEFVRVKLKCTQDGMVAESTGHQISSRLNSVVGANGLLYLPGKSSTEEGVEYEAYVIGSLY